MPASVPRICDQRHDVRDGEQAPGVAFTTRREARYRARFGGERRSTRSRPARRRWAPRSSATSPPSWWKIWRPGSSPGAGCVCEDVDAALAAGVKTINLSAPMSDAQIAVKFGGSRAAMLVALRDVVGYARRQGLAVALGGEDASRAGPAELAPVLDLAEKLGVIRFRYADTLGVLDPVSVSQRIGAVRALTDLPIEFHGHDDLGLATANTLAALRGGRDACERDDTGAGRARGQRRAGADRRGCRTARDRNLRGRPARSARLA